MLHRYCAVAHLCAGRHAADAPSISATSSTPGLQLLLLVLLLLLRARGVLLPLPGLPLEAAARAAAARAAGVFGLCTAPGMSLMSKVSRNSLSRGAGPSGTCTPLQTQQQGQEHRKDDEPFCSLHCLGLMESSPPAPLPQTRSSQPTRNCANSKFKLATTCCISSQYMITCITCHVAGTNLPVARR